MGRSEKDPAVKDRRPWNVDRTVGAKRALKPRQVWAIRFWLDRQRWLRDRAMFDLAIDSKLRGCDVVKVKIGDLVSGGRIRHAPSSSSRRPVGPFSSNSSSRPGAAFWLGPNAEVALLTNSSFRAGSIALITSALANMRGWLKNG